MGKPYCILVADRNRHVREYLRREFAAEGYRVRLAANGREVLYWVFHEEHLDLVVLDPNLSDEQDLKLLEKIQDRIPPLPVILHGFFADDMPPPEAVYGVCFVEKRGGSIEELKKAVGRMLQIPSVFS